MAFACKSKKKQDPPNNLPEKIESTRFFSTPPPSFLENTAAFDTFVPTFSSRCATRRTAPPPRETRGGSEQEWEERSLYTRASVNFRKQSSPFTGTYNPLNRKHLRVKALNQMKVHRCIIRHLITDNKHTGEGEVKA